MDERRVKNAKNLTLVLTAGIGSDHIDGDVAFEHGITVAEVTGSNDVTRCLPTTLGNAGRAGPHRRRHGRPSRSRRIPRRGCRGARSAPRGSPPLHRAVTDQAHMGAVAPTSRPLARRVAEFVPRTPGLRVLELGAGTGTGTISTAIGLRLGAASRHIALDRDRDLLAALDRSAPWAQQLVGEVGELDSVLSAAQVDTVDVVISSLPWSNFGPSAQRLVLKHITTVLEPGGVFATVAYRPARLIYGMWTFRAALHDSFVRVHTSATERRSVPPARAIICRGPRRQ